MRDQVFISYSHKDSKWLDKLQTMLKPFVRNNPIAVWSDEAIKSGAKWRQEIDNALARAKVAVLLVSDNFLASDFIAQHELPPILAAAETEGLLILSIHITASGYETTEIQDYQATHDPSRPLDSLKPSRQRAVLLEICKKIQAAASEPVVSATEGTARKSTASTAVYCGIPTPSRDQPFVGRKELLKTLKVSLLQGERRVLELLPGVGKTELAIVLAHDSEVREHFADGILWADLGRQPDLIEKLQKWAKALGLPENEISRPRSMAEWQETVHDRIGKRHMLIVLDDVWKIEHATTFMDLGTHCGYLVTTRLPKVAANAALMCRKERVPELENADGLDLLMALAPDAVQANRAAAQKLVEAVGGLPLALVLVGCQLRLDSEDGSPGEILLALNKLEDAKQRLTLEKPPRRDGDPPISLNAAIDISYEALDNEESRRALTALSILRPKPNAFSEDIALLVSQADLTTISELRKAGFIEYDKQRGGYTLHRAIAEFAREKLSQEESQVLHRRALQYYEEQSRQYDENPHYEGWYRYENPEWRSLNDDRLYHLAHSGDEAAAMLEFARTYFDAFWWWGCFRDFSLCNELLDEWWQKEISLEGKNGIQLLLKFQGSYPKETEDRRSGDWSTVETALTDLLKIIRLDGDSTQFSEKQQRHIRGLAEIFLAEARRFGYDDHDGAAERYRQAHTLFSRNNDDWVRAWIAAHAADNDCERGYLAEAAQLSAEAMTLALAEHDPELVALTHRIQGDLFIKQGDVEQAAQSYAQATFHAYRFQIDPDSPDEYTVDFYRETTVLVVSRLAALARSDAVRLAGALYRFWAPGRGSGEVVFPDVDALLDATALDELCAHLFPPGLDPDVVDECGAAYAEEVAAALGRMNAAAHHNKPVSV